MNEFTNCNSLELYKYNYYKKFPFKGLIKIITDIPKIFFENNTIDYTSKEALCILIDHEVPYRDYVIKENYPIILPHGMLHFMKPESNNYIKSLARIEVINILKNIIYFNEYFHKYIYHKDNVLKLLNYKLEILLEEEALERLYKISAKKIYYAWYHAYSNPYNSICKRRLLREFNKIIENNNT